MTVLPHDPRWPRVDTWLSANSALAPVDLAILGIPTWRTSLSTTGAGETPAAVREALRRYSPWASGCDLSVLTARDFGDVANPDDDEDSAIATMRAAADAARLVVVLGGDNAATVPAALGSYAGDIATAGLVTVDAHHDLRDGRSNGSPVRRLVEAGLDGGRVVQIGIDDFVNSADYAARARDVGITVIRRDVLLRRPMDDVMVEALEIACSAGGPVHVDLDVDVCDRSVAPACPASVPGGISAYELRRAARVAGRHSSVGSVDLTEVDATRDTADGRTVRLMALCVLEVAAGLAERT